MDPNATLHSIRQLIREIMNDDEASHQATELAELVAALDTWIFKGGFLPKNWEKKE